MTSTDVEKAAEARGPSESFEDSSKETNRRHGPRVRYSPASCGPRRRTHASMTFPTDDPPIDKEKGRSGPGRSRGQDHP